MTRERDAGSILATIGAWLGAGAMAVAAFLVLPFTGGGALPRTLPTPPVTITTPTTPAVAITTPTTPTAAVVAPALRPARVVGITEPPPPAWPIVCGPVTIALADGPLANPGTELELVGAGGITVLTDVGTLHDAGVATGGCK